MLKLIKNFILYSSAAIVSLTLLMFYLYSPPANLKMVSFALDNQNKHGAGLVLNYTQVPWSVLIFTANLSVKNFGLSITKYEIDEEPMSLATFYLPQRTDKLASRILFAVPQKSGL